MEGYPVTIRRGVIRGVWLLWLLWGCTGPDDIAGQAGTVIKKMPAYRTEKGVIAEERQIRVPRTGPLYYSSNKPDPFQPQILFNDEDKGSIDTLPPEIDLSHYRLKGIIRKTGGNLALVEVPGGRGYVITRDNYLDKYPLRVTEILEDRVRFQERITDGQGKPLVRSYELRLRQNSG